MNTSLYTVRAVVVLDSAGRRILSKYYSAPGSPLSPLCPSAAEQTAFEKKLNEKTVARKGPSASRSGSRSSGAAISVDEDGAFGSPEIALIDGQLVFYRIVGDVYFYLVGHPDENEILLSSVLNGFVDAVIQLVSSQLDYGLTVHNYDLVCLALDEAIDDGIAAETDSRVIVSRVSKRPDVVNLDLANLNEQSIRSAARTYRDKLVSSIFNL
ncbi:hypothetical protein GQ42DRAFT_159776 [Ramicandelaber brevisporus]|nr:hypothetical protein GQ42DRAFT_159776 [Ramicandelaber brevisporus]